MTSCSFHFIGGMERCKIPYSLIPTGKNLLHFLSRKKKLEPDPPAINNDRSLSAKGSHWGSVKSKEVCNINRPGM